MQLKLTTAIAAAALVATSAAAHASPIARFTDANVSAVLKSAGATDIAQKVVENGPRLVFKMGEVSLVADLFGCEAGKGCTGLMFMVAYDPNPTDTLDAVNAFNDKYVYGKAVLEKPSGLLISMRTINGGAGSSTEQVADELALFIGVNDVLLDHMQKSTLSVSYGPRSATAGIVLRPNQVTAPTRWNTLPHNRRR